MQAAPHFPELPLEPRSGVARLGRVRHFKCGPVELNHALDAVIAAKLKKEIEGAPAESHVLRLLFLYVLRRHQRRVCDPQATLGLQKKQRVLAQFQSRIPPAEPPYGLIAALVRYRTYREGSPRPTRALLRPPYSQMNFSSPLFKNFQIPSKYFGGIADKTATWN